MVAELLTDASRATDANSNPYSGAKWYFYATGTTTPQSVYTTSALNVAHANPVVADSGGKFAPIYFDSSLLYRGILKNADDSVTIYDIDPINAGVLALLNSIAGAASIGTSSGDTVQEAIDSFDTSISTLEQITTATGLSGNGPNVIQFPDYNFLNTGASASAVAAGTADQPNIVGGDGYFTTVNGDGVTASFNVSPGFTVLDATYRNILVVNEVTATASRTLWVEGTNYTVSGKGTGTITITPSSTLPATERLRIRVYRKNNSAFSPLLNFAGWGYDNFNDGSGSMVVQLGAHHVNIGNSGGHNSFLGGSTHIMRGSTSYTSAFGLSNEANASLAGVMGGMRNYITGTAPTAFGASNLAGGWSLAVGELCDASALYSQAFGRGAKSRISGDLAQSVGSSADPSPGRMGIHQYGLRRVLTSASFATAIPSTGNTYFAMPLGSKAWVELDVLLSEIATGNFRKLSLNMCIGRDSGGTMTYEYGDGSGANQNNANEDAANVTPSVNEWSARILTTASGGFNVQVSGQASLTIQALIRAKVLCIADDAAAV